MTTTEDIDYGPLSGLIGVWHGDKGLDIAPEPEGIERNPYFETITFKGGGDVTNAESQVLTVLHYRQIVQRKSNNKVFHDETGYWMWDAEQQIIMHSLTIPRGVCVLAGAVYTVEKTVDDELILQVSASVEDKDWQIIQSPFMQKQARTTAFNHRIELGNGTLSYKEITTVEIYGKVFDHIDQNQLLRQ